MKPLISEKAADFRRSISPVKQIMSFASPETFKKYGYEPKDIISFAGGWVNHSSPEGLRESYLKIMQDKDVFHASGGYPPTLGTQECREALVQMEKHLYGASGVDAKNVAIGASSTQLTYNLFTILLNPGEKILLLDPSYCNLPSQIITALNAEIIRFPVLDKISWKYEANEKTEEFYRFILEHKPKVILLTSPDNPTSQILSDKFIEAGLKAAEEIGSFLIIDFAYKHLVFEEYPKYFSWSHNDNFISIHSNSKWCRGLGRRLGWIFAPEFVVEAMESIQGSSILCPDMLHEMALAKYINDAIAKNEMKPYIESAKNAYKQAADITIKAIDKYLGIPRLQPQGGLYTVLKTDMDGAKFVEETIKQQGVLLVPGWGFGRTLIEGVRLCYGPLVKNSDLIEKGIEKISKVIKK
ncbi:MAG: hypothetical protein ACD_51C00327G0001 [uncultured bacterium]|nr:MAG: hypothetical protein ACD_51C00327G0001 [uncultured bacterium]